jgi:DinB family protein
VARIRVWFTNLGLPFDFLFLKKTVTADEHMNSTTQTFPDIQSLYDQLSAIERDAQSFASLDEEISKRKPSPITWSIDECLDHLSITNHQYLDAMRPAAQHAREKSRTRRGPAKPGILGAYFARIMEPPVKPNKKMKAPQVIRPQSQQPHAEIYAAFLNSHHSVENFLTDVAPLDLSHIRFPNPLIKAIRFSLATGLHVLLAHERRHLWQAHQILDSSRP